MTVLVPVARALTAGIFLAAAPDHVKNPAGPAQYAGPFLGKLRESVNIPLTDEQLVQVNSGAQTAAAAALALGKFPRLAPLTLIGSLIPTTLAGHAFWEVEDPEHRQTQQIQFSKNVAILGSLVFALAAGGQRRKIKKLKQQSD